MENQSFTSHSSTTKEDAIENLGEVFLIGFSGKTLSDETSAFLQQARIGGVILFAHNYSDPAQVSALVTQIQECKHRLPLWISVDQEGGIVQRFKAPFTIWPKAEAVAKLNSPKLTFELSEAIAKELKSVGVNLNFTPVADILTNPQNPVIGTRAFGTDEDTVSKMVSAIVRGHVTAGVQPCVKHFPGHGDTDLDSHFALPSVDTPLDVLRDRELKPFSRAFKARCCFVMTAHILCKSIDPEVPATFSRKILQEILRGELRYQKLIISDDLQMQAITDHFGADEAPIRALLAGCDILIYRTEDFARHAYASVKRALENGDLSPAVVNGAINRIRAVKEETLLPYHPHDANAWKEIVGCSAFQELAQKFPE